MGKQFGGEYFPFPKLLRKGGEGSLEGNTFHFPCSSTKYVYTPACCLKIGSK